MLAPKARRPRRDPNIPAAYHVATVGPQNCLFRRRFAQCVATRDPPPRATRCDGKEETCRAHRAQNRSASGTSGGNSVTVPSSGRPGSRRRTPSTLHLRRLSGRDQRVAEIKDEILKGYLTGLLKRARRELPGRGYDRDRATAALQRRLNRVTE